MGKFSNWLARHPIAILIYLVYTTYAYYVNDQFIPTIIFGGFCIFLLFAIPILRVKISETNIVIVRALALLGTFLAFSYPLAGLLSLIPDKYLVLQSADWVGLYSVAFTGFVTMYSIWVTIEESRKQNDKTLAIQSIPLITISLDESRLQKEFRVFTPETQPKDKPHKYNILLFLEIRNDYPNIAKGVYIDAIDLSVVSDLDNLTEHISDSELIAFKNNIIKSVGTIPLLPHNFIKSISAPLRMRYDSVHLIELTISLKYTDYLGKITHNTRSQVSIFFDFRKSEQVGANTFDYYELTPKTKFEFIE